MQTTNLRDITCAGIVTYNPDLLRLQQNINGINNNRIVRIIIVDNGSANIEKLEELIKEQKQILLIKNEKNEGIAYALNQIFIEASEDDSFKWVLTLDQDTIINDNLMDIYNKYYDSEHNIGSITSIRHDRAYSETQKHDNVPTEFVDRCITSGNLVRVDAWKSIHGFDNRLFIDMVDYDFCYRLREKGFQILRINQPCILHELGKPTIVYFLGKKRIVYNHSAFRKYYICRNYIYTLRNFGKYAKKDDSYGFLVRLFVKTLFYEKDDKAKKLFNMIKGIFDGLRLKRIQL